jgi:flagellar FliL protein
MTEEAKKDDAPKKGRKLPIIVAGVVVALAAGGGGAYFFLKGGKHEEDPKVAEEAQRQKELKSKVFVNLEPFTVNLAGEEERFAQVSIVLELASNELGEEIKTLMPAVRNNVLLLLSGKEPRDLITLEGKELLADQVAVQTLKAIGRFTPETPKAKKEDAEHADGAHSGEADEKSEAKPHAVKASMAVPLVKVHFSQFIVQ